MKRTREIKAMPKHPNKFDTEFFELDITGTYTKAEMQHLIQDMDNAVHH